MNSPIRYMKTTKVEIEIKGTGYKVRRLKHAANGMWIPDYSFEPKFVTNHEISIEDIFALFEDVNPDKDNNT